MLNYFVTLHSTETEEIVGHVAPIEPMDIDKFDDVLRVSWADYEKQADDDDYCIEGFVEFHNKNYEPQIDWVVESFIQL